MTITKLQFEDKFRGWSLKETSFSSFNLLVGMSGVGKTRILEALRTVKGAGLSDANLPRNANFSNGCSWKVEIEADDVKYTWSASKSLVARTPMSEFALEIEEDSESVNSSNFLYEHIEQFTGDTSKVLVDRTPDVFMFNGVHLPRLKNNESAISLLRNEESIAPLSKSLRRIVFSEAPNSPTAFFGFVRYDDAEYISVRKRFRTLDALREAPDVPILVKGYILQREYPAEFERIKEDYKDIFPTVCDVTLGKWTDLDPFVSADAEFYADLLAIAVKEDGIDGWITSHRLSSGMLRTLVHLIELAMAPSGTVIVIDEVENSLGVNCLLPLTDRLKHRSDDLQFIITSHHPYIIRNIPSSRWRIVTRKGSVITVLNEAQVPALRTNSSQDKFIQLINSTEYEEGIK